jgi:hypothetical protein
METRRGFFKSLALNLTAAMAMAWGAPIRAVKAFAPLTDAELNDLFMEALRAEILKGVAKAWGAPKSSFYWNPRSVRVRAYSGFDRLYEGRWTVAPAVLDVIPDGASIPEGWKPDKFLDLGSLAPIEAAS